MGKYVKGRGMGEEQAAEKVVAIAKRVQRNHPDAQPISILTAAASVLFLAGFTDPKDRHVLHAADRIRERLADAPTPPPARGMPDARTLDDRQQAILEGIRPTFEEMMRRLRPSVPESTWRLWLEPVTVCGIRDTTLLVSAPEGIRAWCERRYASLMLEAARDVDADRITHISFVDWVPFGEPQCHDQPGEGTEPRHREQPGGQQ